MTTATTSTNVLLVDAVRSPFGKAGSLYAGTRADDIIVRCIRGLLERNPQIKPTDVDDVAIAVATQFGDQGIFRRHDSHGQRSRGESYRKCAHAAPSAVF